MLDASEDAVANYTYIYTLDGHLLILTAAHLLFSSKYDRTMAGKEIDLPQDPVFASTVQKGDLVFVKSSNGKLQPQEVLGTMVKEMRGSYAPLTKEGTIVINDVAASCYAVINDHHLAHRAFAPLHYLYNVLPSTLLSKQTEGISWYPRLLQILGSIFLDENSYYPIESKKLLDINGA